MALSLNPLPVAALSALLALTACGSDESAQITPGSPDFAGAGNALPGGVAGSTQFAAADGGPVHGTFRVVDPEGEITIETVNPDGTLSIAYADGSEETGRWVQKGAGTFCVTMNWSGASEACFQERVNSKGDWLSYDPESQTASRIQRLPPAE